MRVPLHLQTPKNEVADAVNKITMRELERIKGASIDLKF